MMIIQRSVALGKNNKKYVHPQVLAYQSIKRQQEHLVKHQRCRSLAKASRLRNRSSGRDGRPTLNSTQPLGLKITSQRHRPNMANNIQQCDISMLFPQVYFSMSSSSNSQPFLHAAVVKASQVSSTGIYTRQAGGETSIQTSVVTMATEFTASCHNWCH